MAETETRRLVFETRPRRDVCRSRDVTETLKCTFIVTNAAYYLNKLTFYASLLSLYCHRVSACFMAVTLPVRARSCTRPSARSCTRSCTLLYTGRRDGRALRAVYTAVYITGRLHGPAHGTAVYTTVYGPGRVH